MRLWMRNEIVMRQFISVLSLLFAFSFVAMSQVVPQNSGTQQAAASSEQASTKDVPPPKNALPTKDVPAAKDAPPRDGERGAKPSDSKAQAANAPEDFIIGPEDVLEIKVWREPDLTTRAVVRPDGKIGVTLVGDIQASGLTAMQLKSEVTTKLDRFVEQPEVSVVVVEIHSQMVTLIGAVGRPGAYSLGGPLTVVELLARAGGLSEAAKSDQIAIVRKKGKSELERIPFNYKEFIEGKNLHSNILLKNGDVVVVLAH
jgi:polysaccharide export outer membrane protein